MEEYFGCGAIFGIVAFFLAWGWAAMEYGYLLGFGLGWLPAMIVGWLATILWPVIALGGLWLWLAGT